MNPSTDPRTNLIAFIDRWLDEQSWHLDQRVIDFALDVRLHVATLPESQPEASRTFALSSAS